MKALTYTFALIALSLLPGCATTTVYKNGRPALRTSADAKGLKFRDGNLTFEAESLDHSTPTKAIGETGSKLIKTGTAGAAQIVLSGVTAGAASAIPK